MPSWPGFIGGSYQSQSVIADTERTVNLYVERIESEGASHPLALYPTPGFHSFVGAAAGISAVGTRAFWSGLVSGTERCFAVVGATLYEVFANQTVTSRGTVAQDSNPAQIHHNGATGGQLLILSGTNAYCYTLSSDTLTLVLTGIATHGGFAHGYGLAFNRATGRVRLSALNDLTTWDASIFFTRSLFADPWQAMFVDGNSLIWLPGTESFEVWYDTGAGTQPFAPLSGLVGRYGIAAPFAYGLSGAQIVWLAKTPEGSDRVIALQGGAPQVVSQYALSTALSGYRRTSKITDAEILMYEDNGHTFCVLAFPSVPATWAFDLDAPSWAERGKWTPALGRYDLWSPRVHCDAFGKHLVGDRTTGTIAVMDRTYATEIDGTGIRRLRIAPGIVREQARLPIDRVELLMDVGVGLTGTGQGSAPVVMLRVSQDGGHTWGNERQASIGRLGDYRRRVYWNRLGAGRDTLIEVTQSDPVPCRFLNAWLNNVAA